MSRVCKNWSAADQQELLGLFRRLDLSPTEELRFRRLRGRWRRALRTMFLVPRYRNSQPVRLSYLRPTPGQVAFVRYLRRPGSSERRS